MARKALLRAKPRKISSSEPRPADHTLHRSLNAVYLRFWQLEVPGIHIRKERIEEHHLNTARMLRFKPFSLQVLYAEA